MRSEEYLCAVKEALEGYDDEVVRELLASLNEHFEQGLLQGRSEEELCDELGPVEDLVKELDDAVPVKNAQETKEQSEAHGAWSGTEHKAQEPAQTALVRRENQDCHPVSKIHAELGFADVKLFHTSEALPFIRLQKGSDEPEQFRLEECFKGDTYEVKLVKKEGESSAQKRSVLEKILEGLSGGVISITIGIHLALELYIPVGIKEVYVKQSSGDIAGSGLNVPQLRLVTTSGDIALSQVRADKLEATSTSGDVDLQDLFGSTVSAASMSGDMSLEDVKAADLGVNSTSGDLDLRECIADAELLVNTTSGDIEMENAMGRRLKLNTVSGDATLEIRCPEAVLGTTSGDLELTFLQDVDAKISTISGDVNIRLKNDRRGFFAKSQTVSGDVHVSYAGSKGHYGKHAEIHTGTETSRFEFRSVSGDIRLSE